MGVVFTARDTELDRMVAIKFVGASAIGGLTVESLKREAKAASAAGLPAEVVTDHADAFDQAAIKRFQVG